MGCATTLRVLRMANGLKQTAMAHLLGVSAPYLSMVENGERAVTDRMVRGYAKVFGLKPGTLWRIDLEEMRVNSLFIDILVRASRKKELKPAELPLFDQLGDA